MKGQLTIQNYKSYTKEDQKIWSKLFEEVIGRLNPSEKQDEKFLESVKKLKLKKGEIPNFENLNKLLKPLANFEVIAVTGELDNTILFHLLRSRKFPVTVSLPNLFNELIGKVPFLLNRTYGDELVALAYNVTTNIGMIDEYRVQYDNYLIDIVKLNEADSAPKETN